MMKIPTMQGVIDRRILVNFRVDADVLSRQLPSPFRPQLVGETGIAGICLIRLKQIRPLGMPSFSGLSSENGAHRIAVEWDEAGQAKQGVFIPRRDTSSRLNAWVGGRLFPGEHHHARFEVEEQGSDYRVAMTSDDGAAHVVVAGRLADALPPNSIFGSLQAASAFFQAGSLGYSPTSTSGEYDGLELRTFAWNVAPLSLERIESSFFDDAAIFPRGSIALDHALLMRNISHQWQGRAAIQEMS
ncbi:DUF2071 domain-containing protein [Blastopirellula sp. J2-11]|uniref:DUF2071 domain-containing protein n=1 Tax=Blastopirellula sp. J2-11 TaxID=2943192 RepID=UPI0021C5A4F4|nr:DUF2071 domain-containing protein [Blastopirellula sp. J2-11]UUO05907.1 DUF2071 domain-containing protein [Blastopirellula sp. J2-11]